MGNIPSVNRMGLPTSSNCLAVRREPGIRPGRVAQRLGIPRSSVMRALPALDDEGLLLYEDERGGLWPWRAGRSKT